MEDDQARQKDITDGELIETVCPACEASGHEVTAVPGITTKIKGTPLEGKETLQEMIETIFQHHKDVLRNNGSCAPALLVTSGEELHICMLGSVMNDDKDRAQLIIQELIKNFKGDSYFMVSECWQGTNPQVMPSEDPDHKEILMIVGQKTGAPSMAISVAFTKIDDKVFFTSEDKEFECKGDNAMTGRFVDLLPTGREDKQA
jgi:hypothetical protein